jgi:hypothetical protein
MGPPPFRGASWKWDIPSSGRPVESTVETPEPVSRATSESGISTPEQAVAGDQSSRYEELYRLIQFPSNWPNGRNSLFRSNIEGIRKYGVEELKVKFDESASGPRREFR